MKETATKIEITSERFRACTIATDDDNDYEESGYVALVVDGVAYLARYGHCSCYGTYEALSISGNILDFNWAGTPTELVRMAKKMADPDMPDRKADPADYDYDHLTETYRQIIEWDKNGRVVEGVRTKRTRKQDGQDAV